MNVGPYLSIALMELEKISHDYMRKEYKKHIEGRKTSFQTS